MLAFLAILCGIFVVTVKNPIKNYGKKLSNSGEFLKLIIPNYIKKYISGWSNYSCMVTIYKIYENIMDDRGSKSKRNKDINLFVKEQRVDGSWYDKNSYLRCTLFGFKRNHLARTLSNHINLTRQFSTKTTLFNTELYNNTELIQLNPWFITGFTDGEGTFGLYINSNNKYKSGYKISKIACLEDE